MYANEQEGQPTTNTELLCALMTEHYTLQSLRGSTIVEANGRGQLFLSTVSGATVALAPVAELDRAGDPFKIFAFTVSPALPQDRRSPTPAAFMLLQRPDRGLPRPKTVLLPTRSTDPSPGNGRVVVTSEAIAEVTTTDR
jgi:hypothetical protein